MARQKIREVMKGGVATAVGHGASNTRSAPCSGGQQATAATASNRMNFKFKTQIENY